MDCFLKLRQACLFTWGAGVATVICGYTFSHQELRGLYNKYTSTYQREVMTELGGFKFHIPVLSN